MEPVFTIPYSEYEVINEFRRHLGKRTGFSIYIPTSRQQKGVDFLLHNSKHNKCLRFQVKGSRCYTESNPNRLRYQLWFNNFVKRYAPGEADFYVLFGLYPAYAVGKPIHARRSAWCPLILCFADREMKDLLAKVLTKKEKRPDRFFNIGFDSPKAVYGTRGFASRIDLTHHLLAQQLTNFEMF
jgi:hypothetical protein